MYIIIVGGGKVGYTLAESLSAEENDVVIVDNDDETIKKTSESIDVMTIRGNGLSANILREAGVAHADLVIAVMATDEINIVSCLTAKKLGAKQTVARIRDPEYAKELITMKDYFGIDMVINPELETAIKISHVLRFPSAVNVETFVRGRVEIVEFRIQQKDNLDGVRISDLQTKLTDPILICAVERGNEVFIPNGNFILKEKDKIYIIGKPTNVSAFSRFLKRSDKRIRNVMITGGSRIAVYLANLTQEMGVNYKIIEQSSARCERLCELVPEAAIISGDGTDEKLLRSEGIHEMDAFIALTDRDEENIISALYAMYGSIPKVIAKINRIGNSDIIDKLGIDTVVSPRMLTANQIIRFVRALKNSQGSSVQALYRIVGDKVEALEFVAGKNTKNLGVPFKELSNQIISGTLVATIVRDGKTIIPMGDDCILEGDNVIIITLKEELSDLSDIFRGVRQR